MISDLLQCCVFRLNLRKDYPFRWEFSPAIEQPVPSTPVSARALQNGSPVPAWLLDAALHECSPQRPESWIQASRSRGEAPIGHFDSPDGSNIPIFSPDGSQSHHPVFDVERVRERRYARTKIVDGQQVRAFTASGSDMPGFRSTSDATQLRKTWSTDAEYRGEEETLRSSRTWGIGNGAAELAPTTNQSPTAPRTQPGERETRRVEECQRRVETVGDSGGREQASDEEARDAQGRPDARENDGASMAETGRGQPAHSQKIADRTSQSSKKSMELP